MSDMVREEKEKFEGVHTKLNIPVRFNRVWSGHRFTDEECQKLLNGEVIGFMATSKKGTEFRAVGLLAQQEFNGHSYWGFRLDTNAIPNAVLKSPSLVAERYN